MPFRPGIQYYNFRSVRSDESKEDLTSTVNKLLINKLLDDEKDEQKFQNFIPGEVDDDSEDKSDSDIKSSMFFDVGTCPPATQNPFSPG